MTTADDRPVLLNPLLSSRPTGMGVAAAGVTAMLVPDLAEDRARWDDMFRWVNDHAPGGALRMFLRFALVQLAAMLVRRRRLIFTSHHGPLWRTGRHAVMVYDMIALNHPEQSGAQSWYYRRVLPRVVGVASQVITISNAARADITRAYPRVGLGQVTVIPVTSSRINRTCRDARGVRERRASRALAFIGARYRHKNLDLVLRVLREWPSEGGSTPPRLIVTSCRRDIWTELAEAERRGLVSVVDFADDSEIDRLLGEAAALIYPSREEGQGLPPLEAMAVGCPVIGSDIPVLRETCGEAATYFPIDDQKALLEVLVRFMDGRSDEEFEQRRELGYDRAARFSSECLRDRWVEFLAGWV